LEFIALWYLFPEGEFKKITPFFTFRCIQERCIVPDTNKQTTSFFGLLNKTAY